MVTKDVFFLFEHVTAQRNRVGYIMRLAGLAEKLTLVQWTFDMAGVNSHRNTTF